MGTDCGSEDMAVLGIVGHDIDKFLKALHPGLREVAPKFCLAAERLLRRHVPP
jgi:hypothetical protein